MDNASFFLSQIYKKKVFNREKKIGSLADLFIIERGKVAEVSRLLVSRPFGYPSLIVPWEKVRSFTSKEIVIDIDSEERYEGEPRDEDVLLRDHVLDKKVLDTDDKEVEVVYDIKLTVNYGKMYVTDVDLSRYGLLRRIKLSWLANFIYSLAEKIKQQTISWSYIQPIPNTISSFSGDIKLNILKEKLSDVHPVDLADILEEMDPEQRARVFDGLDTKRASDTLEEIDPSVQRQLISSLEKEKAAKLIDDMTPAQAADVLSILPWNEADSILKFLSEDKAAKITSIIDKQEENILNYATVNVLKFGPDVTDKQAEEEYHRVAKGKDVVMYLYIVDDQDKLLGVIDVKELLLASDEMLLKDIMIEEVVSLNPESTIKDAFAMFSRYGFRAIPVTNKEDKLLGVIPYKDIMNLKHRFI
jgi:magnesium transporter